jgi:hypothetical protein
VIPPTERTKPSPPLARPLSPLSDSSSVAPPSPSHSPRHKRLRQQAKEEEEQRVEVKKEQGVDDEEEYYCQPTHTPFPALGTRQLRFSII